MNRMTGASRWVRAALQGYLLIALGVALVAGGYIWRGNYTVQVAAFGIAGVGVLVYLGVRGLVQHAEWSPTGLEAALGLAGLAVLVSWLSSPDIRLGVWRVMALLGYALVFILFVDAFRAGLPGEWMVRLLLLFTGLLSMMAVLETYAAYLAWGQSVGQGVQPPFTYRFVGLIGHPNALMGLVNLAAPLAVVALIQSRGRWMRFLCVLWLVLYALCVPFSSSRGGWAGLIGWVGALAVLWAVEKRAWRYLARLNSPTGRWVALGASVGLVSLAILGYRLLINFTAHPSHGVTTNPFAGRSGIWQIVLDAWRTSPWVGVGPGRVSFEYLAAGKIAPPGFWAVHAHGMPVEVLAEFGILGVAALIFLVGWGGVQFWRCYLSAHAERRAWAIALLAAVVGWLLQMMVDDQTLVFGEMVWLMILLACLTTLRPVTESTWKVSLNWLWLPLMFWLAVTGWTLWAGKPFADGLAAAKLGQMRQAAQAMTLSQQHDPGLSFYATQAGLAWAQVYAESVNPADLEQARSLLQTSLDREPAASWLWANLAILDARANALPAALQHIQQAIAYAPKTPAYWLNYGVILEQNGQAADAQQAYQSALTLAPDWANHPFWQTSPVRLAARQSWNVPDSPAQAQTYNQQARAATLAGDFRGAQQNLAAARWALEPGLETAVTNAQLVAARDGVQAAQPALQAVVAQMNPNRLNAGTNFALTYSLWLFNRDGLANDLVPGVRQLAPDVGQFAAARSLFDLYAKSGDCMRAGEVWSALQRAEQGGGLEAGAPQPICPTQTGALQP